MCFKIINFKFRISNYLEKDIELIPDTVKVNTQLCQAIILNEKTLLSSATCASLLDSNYTAKAGSVDLVKLFESKGFKVKETIIHPNWTYQNGLFINDVALVILDDEIEFKRNRIEPACFDFNNTKEYSDSLFAAGHGNGKRVDSEKSDEENRSRFVKEIYLIEKSNDKNTCFDDSVIYVEATKDEQRYGNITLSENDSGTGLMIFKSDKFYVVGILNISPMAVAEDNEYFFMFTRLSKHWEWIEKHVKNDFCEASY